MWLLIKGSDAEARRGRAAEITERERARACSAAASSRRSARDADRVWSSGHGEAKAPLRAKARKQATGARAAPAGSRVGRLPRASAAAARDARRRAARRRRLAARDQARRLPDARAHRGRQRAAADARRPRLDAALPRARGGARGAPRRRRAARRRGRRARRAGPQPLPAAPERAEGGTVAISTSTCSISCTSTAATCATRRSSSASEPLRSPARRLRGATAIRYSDHVQGDGAGVLRARRASSGAEGIVSKRATAPYRSGRTRDWLKVKCGQRQEFVIVGFTEPAGLARRARRAAARRLRRRGHASLRRQGRHRLRRRDAARAAQRLGALERETPLRSPTRARGARRALGDAEARRRGGVHRVDGATARSAIPSFIALARATSRRPRSGGRCPKPCRGARSRRGRDGARIRGAALARRSRGRAALDPGPRLLSRISASPRASSRSTTRRWPSACCRVSPIGRSGWCAARRARRRSASTRSTRPTAVPERVGRVVDRRGRGALRDGDGPRVACLAGADRGASSSTSGARAPTRSSSPISSSSISIPTRRCRGGASRTRRGCCAPSSRSSARAVRAHDGRQGPARRRRRSCGARAGTR